jgi:hypothetical protein
LAIYLRRATGLLSCPLHATFRPLLSMSRSHVFWSQPPWPPRLAVGACDLQRDSPADASFHRRLRRSELRLAPCKQRLRALLSSCPSYHRCRNASAQRHCQGQVRVTCRGRDILQLQLVFGCMRSFSFDCFLVLLHQALPCLAALFKF